MAKNKRLDITSKSILLVILIVLLFIAFELHKENSIPQNKLECLKLGSNERAEACLDLLEQQEEGFSNQEPFPIEDLLIEDVGAENTGLCIMISGVVYNQSSEQATNIALKVDFTKTELGSPFHYETFSPFESVHERVQPDSRKSFSKCLRQQSFNALKNVDNWYFSVSPFEASIYSAQ